MSLEQTATATDKLENTKNNHEMLLDSLRMASKKIAPVWPLENFVAVNPYLGLVNQSFESAAYDLAQAGGIKMTLPVSFYQKKIQEGIISRNDLEEALNKQLGLSKISVDDFLRALEADPHKEEDPAPVNTVADIATQLTEKDWNRMVTSRISSWASSYFDKGQAVWNVGNQNDEPFKAWKSEAEIDLTSEISGLKGFRSLVKSFPDNALDAAQKALDILGLPENGMSIYLHRLLLKVGGWSAHSARLDWDSELNGGQDGKLIEFLAILCCWEACLLQCVEHPNLQKKWSEAKIYLSSINILQEPNRPLEQKLILQEAFDISEQRNLIEKVNNIESGPIQNSVKPKAQAIFCIDVRSEVFRRNLEQVDPDIETLGFAGFFAFPIKFVPIAHEGGEAQCPVLLTTGPTILEEIGDVKENSRAFKNRTLQHQVKKNWKSFKSGAISCFSYVSPIGLSYLPKLFTDSFGMTRPVPHPDKAGLNSRYVRSKGISLDVTTHNNETVGIAMDQRIAMAKNALKAMSLTENFAQFVLIVGHGSSSVNNPHATGLDCGACGGHSGESNARVAAAVLNDKTVRASLSEDGILIPDSTVFIACLHDTTTDEISLFNTNDVAEENISDLMEVKKSLELAGFAARKERSLRMSGEDNTDELVKARSTDWSQIRPEWGLAGCSAFVVAPRERTKHLDLQGKSFLHSYDWKKDQNFAVLELIMTAPMVVTSWINLQYYASTVDQVNYGAGNKTLHNVTAGIGVLEGYSGDLRIGLPIQSVHDGENYQHEPLKLNVIIEAPIEAMNAVLEKHESVRNLCDNSWIHLLAMNSEGKVSHRYQGNLNWDVI